MNELIPHRRLLGLDVMTRLYEADAYAVFQVLKRSVPSCARIDRAPVQRDMKALVVAGALEICGSEMGQTGHVKALYRPTDEARRILADQVAHHVAAEREAGNVLDGPLSRFADLVTLAEEHHPELVAALIQSRVAALKSRLTAPLFDVNAAGKAARGNWSESLHDGLRKLLSCELEILCTWLSGKVGGDDADSMNDIESKSAGTESGEMAAPVETVDDVNGAPDSGTADEDEPYVPWRGGDGWGDD